ncbi:MAG: IS66 family insertion sequence element accessory protein TnpB [Proteobacteria bacterium]|nr:IS66 family insertion sequence element accessory protein TnpB [Pseudomonadota bacterium]
MIPVPPRILVARDPVDFRKGIAGLAAVCEVHLGEEPLDGTLFVFANRRRNGLKMLVWTHGGFLMLYKRLEKGRFRWPPMQADRGVITQAELAALMEGIDLSRARRLSRWNPKKRSADADRRG